MLKKNLSNRTFYNFSLSSNSSSTKNLKNHFINYLSESNNNNEKNSLNLINKKLNNKYKNNLSSENKLILSDTNWTNNSKAKINKNKTKISFIKRENSFNKNNKIFNKEIKIFTYKENNNNNNNNNDSFNKNKKYNFYIKKFLQSKKYNSTENIFIKNNDKFNVNNYKINHIKFLPKIYSNFYFSSENKNKFAPVESLSSFKNSINYLRMANFNKFTLNKKLNEKNLSIQNEIDYFNNKIYSLNLNKNYLLKFSENLNFYVNQLKNVLNVENNFLVKLEFKKSDLIRKNFEIKKKIDFLMKEKKILCKIKVLLFLLKFNCKNLNEIKDKNLLKKFGFDFSVFNLKNCFDYYDNKNDNEKNYCKLNNPKIFNSIQEFENVFFNKENNIILLLENFILINENKPEIIKNFKHLKFLEENKNKQNNFIINNLIKNVKFLKEKNLFLLQNLNSLKKIRKNFEYKKLLKKFIEIFNNNFIIFYSEKLNIEINKNFFENQTNFFVINFINYYEKIINFIIHQNQNFKNQNLHFYNKIKLFYLKNKIHFKSNKNSFDYKKKDDDDLFKKIIEKNSKILYKNKFKIKEFPKNSKIKSNSQEKKIVEEKNILSDLILY